MTAGLSSVTPEIVYKYFPGLSAAQKLRFEQLAALYADWNEKINVISRKDIGQIYERHVLHSLGIARVIQFLPGASVLDAGCGGGFPGIPLAILLPGTHFHLVDSIGKKIRVVKEVAQGLALTNVTAEQARVEQLTGSYDFVVSRAVTQIDEFYRWIRGKISDNHKHSIRNGILYLKGGDLAEEMKKLRKNYREFSLAEFFEEEFFETKKVIYIPADH